MNRSWSRRRNRITASWENEVCNARSLSRMISVMRSGILALAFVAASVASAATWTSHGPYGGAINALASSANGRVIFAGQAAGVFRSDDAGETWRDVSGG